MAARVDRIEMEYLMTEAKAKGARFRLHAPGRTGSARLARFGAETFEFSPLEAVEPRLRAGEGVSVHFSLHDQAFAFGAIVWKTAGSHFELRPQGSIYRGLERRWPRIPDPAGLTADILVPESDGTTSFPRSLDFAEVVKPEETAGLDVSDLPSLVRSFGAAASRISTANRLRMLREGGGPETRAEAVAARFGRMLYVPSAWAPEFPERDPSGKDRLVTGSMVAAAENVELPEADSELLRFIRGESRAGLNSLLVCPVLYWHSVVGFIYLENGAERPRPLDHEALDLAWAFSRQLAWFLRLHGYYGEKEHRLATRAEILDASPGGLQVLLGASEPLLRPGSSFDLKLNFPKGKLGCRARVTRRREYGNRVRYGLSLEGLGKTTLQALERGFYGRPEAIEPGMRS